MNNYMEWIESVQKSREAQIKEREYKAILEAMMTEELREATKALVEKYPGMKWRGYIFADTLDSDGKPEIEVSIGQH